jgi:hypothetical protein
MPQLSDPKYSYEPKVQSWQAGLIAAIILFLPIRKLRWKLLAKLKYQPPLWYTKRRIKRTFFKRLNRRLDLDNGESFNDKLQYLKLYYRPPICSELADKLAVRDFVKTLGLSEILIPIYASYNSIDEINLDALPDQFVMKVTHNSGGVFIVKDKSRFDLKAAKQKMKKLMALPYINGVQNGEWQYLAIKPRIIVEALLISHDEQGNENDLRDFKFNCFSGRVEWISVDINRHVNHCRNVYDRDWNKQEDLSIAKPTSTTDVAKPKSLPKMISIAEQLSQGFPYCRIDLYDVNGKIYFGEVTFHETNGMAKFSTFEWEKKFGDKINLPQIKTY